MHYDDALIGKGELLFFMYYSTCIQVCHEYYNSLFSEGRGRHDSSVQD